MKYVLFFWAMVTVQTVHKLSYTLTGKPPLFSTYNPTLL